MHSRVRERGGFISQTNPFALIKLPREVLFI